MNEASKRQQLASGKRRGWKRILGRAGGMLAKLGRLPKGAYEWTMFALSAVMGGRRRDRRRKQPPRPRGG